MLRPLARCLVLLRLTALLSADEARFDPPLGGIYLGLLGDGRPGRLLVREVEKGSAAARAGLRVGDEIVRLGTKAGFADYQEFAGAVGDLRPGKAVEVEVARGGGREVLPLVPDPGILRDHFQLLSYLRESRFLRGREGFGLLLSKWESTVPEELRGASRASQAYHILNRALGRLGTSHALVIPPWAYRNLFAAELAGEEAHATGMLLEKIEGPEGESFFAMEILEASPAAQGGVRVGDEVLRVNGVPVAESPRRSLAGFEAHRPRYTLQVEEGETIRIELRRAADERTVEMSLTADRPVSCLRSSAASLRPMEREGRRLTYLHLWNLLSPQIVELLARALSGQGDPPEGLVLDLRGRGGQVGVMTRVVAALKQSRMPVALLIDRETRSAKEILAFQMKGSPHVVLVGERTAGAVLPGSYLKLPGGAMVMLPADPGRIQKLTEGGLEGKGVEPDIQVSRPGPYSAGADPIREAGIRAVIEELREVPRRRRL